jgi:hypothetical protein
MRRARSTGLRVLLATALSASCRPVGEAPESAAAGERATERTAMVRDQIAARGVDPTSWR